jgi:hypothetical protein
MIEWFLTMDSWGFPEVKRRKNKLIFTGFRKVQYNETAQNEGPFEPEFTSIYPYSDDSEYPWLFDPNYRPPDRGEAEYDRTQDLPEQERYQNPYDEPEFHPPPEYPFHDYNYGP